MASIEDVNNLIDAMAQLLDDMGHSGQSVCLTAKAQARVAFEPFMEDEDSAIYMSLDVAKRVLAEADSIATFLSRKRS